jgi:hypothetical protein
MIKTQDSFGHETMTTLYLYAKGKTNWNDTVIFFVTFILFWFIFLVGMVLIIIFRKYLLDE